MVVTFILYFLSAAALVYFSMKCADYVDLLDKKTNMSGAFIGGVILAAITSLPELVTSITAITVVDTFCHSNRLLFYLFFIIPQKQAKVKRFV